jgi:L-lactate utilization protein LutC
MALVTEETTTNKYATPASSESVLEAKEALENNGFKVKIVDDLAQAKTEVFKMIPEKSEVFTATSVTLDQAGISKEANESGKYVSVRYKFMALAGKPENAVQMRRIGSGADYSLGSAHAITEDGQIVVASASGSQLPNIVYGASNVILVVGSQKIVEDLDQAFDRLETHTFPLEDKRALKAYGAHSSLNKILIYRKETANRVTVILVKQAVGF